MTIRAPAARWGSASCTSASGARTLTSYACAELVERVLGQRRQRCGAEHAGVVDDQVDRPSGRLHEPAAVLRVGDVARDGDDAVEAGDGALERIAVARVDRQPPAALGQRTREREPEPARGAGDDCRASRFHRHAVAGDDPVVVQPQQLDHVADVRVALDPARAEAGPAGEDRVVVDPLLLEELGPHLLREAEVGDVVAVQVADLAAADGEGELAAAADARVDARPRGTSLVIVSLALI